MMTRGEWHANACTAFACTTTAGGVAHMDQGFLAFLYRRVMERGLSLRRLAAVAGVHHSTLSRVLRGRRAPTPELLVALAPALGISVHELLQRAGIGGEVQDTGLVDLGLPFVLPVEALEQELVQLSRLAEDPAVRRMVAEEYPRKRASMASSGPIADHLDALFHLADSPGVAPNRRRLAAAAVLYFVLGHDRIPDDLFAIGYLDDAWVVERVWREVGTGTELVQPTNDGDNLT